MVKKYLIYTLLLFFSFIWINNLGKQKTKSLFESTGEPRRIYESRITIWDQERQIAKIITNNLEETKENSMFIEMENDKMANQSVLACYHQNLHLMGPLAGNVLRIAPPLIIQPTEAEEGIKRMEQAFRSF